MLFHSVLHIFSCFLVLSPLDQTSILTHKKEKQLFGGWFPHWQFNKKCYICIFPDIGKGMVILFFCIFSLFITEFLYSIINAILI